MQTDMVTTASGNALPPVQTDRYEGPTYYDRPAIKSSPYGWLVWSYIYIAGISGGAQIIATIANLVRRPQLQSVVRNGSYIAAAGSAIGSVLLIADLHTPQRWYNMVRIFRKTSPMSIGSYILTTFGITSAVTATSQFFRAHAPGWLQRSATIAQVPAALSGAGMTCYTGALLSATSTPMWAATPRLLAARFASSAMATAAAALSLAEHVRGGRRNSYNGDNSDSSHNSRLLDRIACIATVADTVLTRVANQQYRKQGVATSLRDAGAEKNQYQLAAGVAHALPLACFALGSAMPQHARKLSVVAALGILGGGLLMRATIMNAGNSSAQRPRDYFAFTQPGQYDKNSRLPHQDMRIGQDHGPTAHQGIAGKMERGLIRP